MPDPLYGMARRLSSLERAAKRFGSTALPASISVLVFSDDCAAAVDCYLSELQGALAAAEVDPLVVCVAQFQPRPAGLMPAWEPGHRRWIDHVPEEHERNHLRPDLQGPIVPRLDHPAPDDLPTVAPDNDPGAEHRARVARAAERRADRSRKDGTSLDGLAASYFRASSQRRPDRAHGTEAPTSQAVRGHELADNEASGSEHSTPSDGGRGHVPSHSTAAPFSLSHTPSRLL